MERATLSRGTNSDSPAAGPARARVSPAYNDVLALQHSAGNAAVNSVLQRKVFLGSQSSVPLEYEAAKKQLVDRFKYVPAALLDTLRAWTKDDISDKRSFLTVEALMEGLKDVERSARGLTGEHVEAVTSYTGGWYQELNKAYRDKNKEWFQIEENKKKVRAFLTGLEKTRPYEHKAALTRVLTFESEKGLEDFRATLPKNNGEIWVSPSALSSKRGADPLLALPAPKKSATGELGGGKTYEFTLRLIAQGFHGADLSTMIKEGAKSEQEVLFPPGTRFQRDDDPMFRRSTTMMQLKELVDLDKAVDELLK